MKINYWDRSKNKLETESVQGSKFLEWGFTTKIGKLVLNRIVATRFFSRIYYGWRTDSKWSVKGIPEFIQRFKIEMDDFEAEKYKTFNDFFIRKFKPTSRSFDSAPHILPAIAEGKYLGYSSTTDAQKFHIKGRQISLAGILGNKKQSQLIPHPQLHPWIDSFEGGPVLVCRLRPSDYHRFHFPDKGNILDHYRLSGQLHATNPACYQFKKDVFLTNERHVTVLETQNFGLLAYVEVGAMGVGRIIQKLKKSSHFSRGEEKGYFMVGGSTVILIGQPGSWIPSPDILDNTSKGLETHVRLGDAAGIIMQH